ncbi:dihydroorotase [Streptomyces chartreusis]|uniref:dihydroorotase n=1 Tax=Streptomyces chartreusis TaxID=1969 RepID=UPI003637E78A
MTTPTPPVGRHLGTLGPVILSGGRILGGKACDIRLSGDGRIAAISPAGTDTTPVRRVPIDDCVVLPAFVDLHTHLREPGGEDSETIASGTHAAAAGGFSDVFAMANSRPVTDTPERVTWIAQTAARTAAARVHVVGAITTGLAGSALAPLEAMAAAGARVFSDDGRCVDDAGILRRALDAARATGTLIAQHAQCRHLAGDGQINAGPAADRTGLPPWPGVAEETIVARDVVLAAESGARLHICHVSTARTADIVRWAKSNGWPVTAEVAPHHLILDDQLTTGANPLYKVNPPLRSTEDVKALRTALQDGTIDAVATDHAPHTSRSKAADWCHAPFGMLGLETALPVVADVLTRAGAPDWVRIAQVMSHQPARIGGIDTLAGRPLAAGEPATFTLVDPAAHWQVDPLDLHSLSRNTPFTSMTFRNRVKATVVDGHVTHDAARLLPAATTRETRP